MGTHSRWPSLRVSVLAPGLDEIVEGCETGGTVRMFEVKRQGSMAVVGGAEEGLSKAGDGCFFGGCAGTNEK